MPAERGETVGRSTGHGRTHARTLVDSVRYPLENTESAVDESTPAGFSCIIQLQAAEERGEFEFVRGLRSPEDESFDDVKAVLLGDRARVEQRSAEPGTFSIFNGTRTLHRVTPVRGDRLSYSLNS